MLLLDLLSKYTLTFKISDSVLMYRIIRKSVQFYTVPTVFSRDLGLCANLNLTDSGAMGMKAIQALDPNMTELSFY